MPPGTLLFIISLYTKYRKKRKRKETTIEHKKQHKLSNEETTKYGSMLDIK